MYKVNVIFLIISALIGIIILLTTHNIDLFLISFVGILILMGLINFFISINLNKNSH